MKIVSYVHAYVPDHNGGAETTLHDLNKALIAEGHECTVVLKQNQGKPAGEYEIEGVQVIQSADKRDVLHHIPRADVVLTHLECSIRAQLLAQSYNIPVGHVVHNDLSLTKRYIAHGCDFIIYNTDWIKAKFHEEFGHIPSIVVHPPILSERYKTDRGRKVTLVNLFERKGSDIFYALAEKMSDVNFLAVKGGYGKQELRHDLPNVEIMEHDFDIKKAYAKTKVILMPSKYESYGRVACEALASGIPSIVADTPGLREALGDSGTYLNPTDVEAWETALRATLTPRKYGSLSKAALARSERLDSLSQDELSTFTLFVEQFASLHKKKR